MVVVDVHESHDHLFQVRDNRAAATVTDVLLPDYAGVLVSDCLVIYDTVPLASKHKCIAHHQKAIREQLDAPGLRDRTYLESWKAFFRGVCEVWRAWPNLDAEQRANVRTHFGRRRDELLSQPLTQDADIRIRNRLEKRKPHLLTCLDYPETVEPTNNRAERALRPAVIARKISCGNKTDRGKQTWERLCSLLTTWCHRGQEAMERLTQRAGLVG